MAREWHARRPGRRADPFAARVTNLVPRPTADVPASVRAVQPRTRRTPCSAQRANIARHYDLSNDLFALFLDETMTYSCAVFEDRGEPLAEAQRRKYELVAELAEVERGCMCSRSAPAGAGWRCIWPTAAAA